jgi:hypothetical protein
VQSQGLKRGQPEKAASSDKEQLERSAEMFEMILQTAPDDVQNYLALKEIYQQLGRKADVNRISRGLAEVHLASGQRQQAAQELVQILESDPTDAQTLRKLQESGYASSDLPILKIEVSLKEIRAGYELKLRELRESEETYAKAAARVRELAEKEGEEKHRILQRIEEEAEKRTQQVIEEKQLWLNEGRTEVFNQVAHRIKEEADRIIQTDHYGNISKSVKEAQRLLASTDSVFQEEWQRVNEQREKDFHEKFEQVRREKEEKLRTAWDDAVTSAKECEEAAEQGLHQVKRELQSLESEMREKEALLKGSRGGVSGEDSPGVKSNENSTPFDQASANFEVLTDTADSLEEDIAEAAARRFARDEAGKTLGAILVQHGVVSPHHLEEAIAEQKKNHRPIGEILVQSGYATHEDIINALVAQAGVPYLPLANYEISDDTAMVIPKELAIKYALMPVDRIAGSLLVAMGIPLNKEQKQEVHQHVRGMRITYFISSWSDIKAMHEQYYG